MLSALKASQKDQRFIQPRALVVTGIVLAAAALRIAPHPLNFTPIGGLALFGGAYFSSKRAAFGIPLLSLVAGDFFIGFHWLIPWVYASFLVSVAIGSWLRQEKSAVRISVATIAGAIQFFLITNFALWASSYSSFSKNAAGLIACYIAGIPLFWNTLAGDGFYVALLFGGMALATRQFPALREQFSARPAIN
jgi:Family of unknown function (DUF6580)